MTNDTKRMLAFAAIPAVGIVILAFALRFITGSTMADLIFSATMSLGGTGALIGFIAGRASRH